MHHQLNFAFFLLYSKSLLFLLPLLSLLYELAYIKIMGDRILKYLILIQVSRIMQASGIYLFYILPKK